MYNGGISNFSHSFIDRKYDGVAQISQGLSYKVCSTTSPIFLHLDYLLFKALQNFSHIPCIKTLTVTEENIDQSHNRKACV